MPAQQSAASHARYEPLFHFILVPILILNLGLSIYTTIHEWPAHPHSHPWWIVMSIVLILMVLLTRGYANRNQDRIIRLEERLRFLELLTPQQNVAAAGLSIRQIIALRFASDAELSALIDKTLSQNLDPKQIKAAIVTWRPDHQRI